MQNFTKPLAALLVMLMTCAVLSAQTNVSGFISVNTTWNLAGSPYIVTGNTLVLHNVSLTIEPGVVVKFNSDKALQIDGQMIAIGTAQNRITFTSNQLNPAPGDWAKIHFADTCAEAVFDAGGNFISGCIMKYCDVQYGGGLDFGSIHIVRSPPYINNCRITNSSSTGIYCYGTSCVIDSSTIKNCADYGLYLEHFYINPCNMLVREDTFEACNGAVYFTSWTDDTCTKTITRCVFKSNITNGAIQGDAITHLVLTENLFINNSAQSSKGVISFPSGSSFIIECNSFIDNESARGAIYASGFSSSISNNIFDGNTSAFGTAVCTVNGGGNGYYLYFSNNIIRNNSSPLGSCCVFLPLFISNGEYLRITNNEFSKNHGQSIIKIKSNWPATDPSFNCLYFKGNNFLDTDLELYNDVPYGCPNIYADGNYWGTTNAAHIDSIIYDYFDFANKSVVYYQPILNTPVQVDTNCSSSPLKVYSPGLATGSFRIFPNPAYSNFTVAFNDLVTVGEIEMYNLLGEKVFTTPIHQTHKEQIDVSGVSNGIYLVRLIIGKEIFTRKLVVQH